jgi:hypothetical protein
MINDKKELNKKKLLINIADVTALWWCGEELENKIENINQDDLLIWS